MRHVSPPPSDAILEKLVTHRVREKVQSDLRQDRKELFNKIDSVVKSLDDKLGSKIEAVNTKLDGTKSDISLQAGAFALGGATLGVSALGFFGPRLVWF